MGRFSRKFKRNPDRVTFDEAGAKVYSDFEGKKAAVKRVRKMFWNLQRQYWKDLNAGLINEDGARIDNNEEDLNDVRLNDLRSRVSDPLDATRIQPGAPNPLDSTRTQP